MKKKYTERLLDDKSLQKLAKLLLKERKEINFDARNEKLKQVLLLLAGGAALVTIIVAPKLSRLFSFNKKESEWKEWKFLNERYLKGVLRRLEKERMIEIRTDGNIGEVVLTQNGKRKILRMSLENITIHKPSRWDGKWRMVFYDVFDGRKNVREQFRRYLKSAGFYPWQKSVYIHAYPCEKEVEFLRDYLGISGEVRIVIADQVENDQQFRDYFNV